jgi:hypothetical protein
MPTIQDIAHAVCDAIQELGILHNLSHHTKLILFGHSMGGLVMYELTKLLLHSTPSLSSQLVLYISNCPHPASLSNYNQDAFTTKYFESTTKLFNNFLYSENYINQQLHSRTNDMFTPLFRKDLELYETYILRMNDEYMHISLENIQILCFETKIRLYDEDSEDDEYHSNDSNENTDEIPPESKLSDTYLTKVYPQFIYSWESISKNADVVYIYHKSLLPRYYMNSTEILDKIVSTVTAKEEELATVVQHK